MESRILPSDVMSDIFDIVKKQEKLYIIFKEDTEESEEKVKKVLGNDLEFTDIFELIHNKLLKNFMDSVSIFDNEPLVEKFGFNEATEIFYDLTRLDQCRKVMFNYALLGRRGNNGALQDLGGKRLGTSSIVLPSEHEKEVESFIKKWNVGYTKRRILVFKED